VAAVGLILGVHRLLSSAFVPVNVLGNAIATLAVARMERAIDLPTFEAELHRPGGADAVDVEPVRADEPAARVAS
jgi:Na+/H+-dicarboxylate symporter